MSKLAVSQRVPYQYDRASIFEIVRQLEQQINALAEGKIVARHGASSSIPAVGVFARSDITWDTTATVSNGTVRLGWVNTAAGEPGTQTEMRALTEDASYKPVLAAEVAATSGTSIDFTGIPSWVKRITIQFAGVSTNGTSSWIIQLGDSGGVENTGYLGASSTISAASAATTNFTAGFGIRTAAATDVVHGAVVLTLEDAANFTWVASGVVSQSDSAVTLTTAGSKSLSAALDRVRITTGGGTDTFDAGAISILYE